MTTYDKIIERLKNHRVIAVFLVICTIITGAWGLFEIFEKIHDKILLNTKPIISDTISTSPVNRNKNNPSKKLQKKKTPSFEVSIQLSTSEGYEKIFLNGLEINALPSSTPFNPRVLVSVEEEMVQEIILISQSEDTCYLNTIFDQNLTQNPPLRFIPKCQH